jgi:hypothetical protein
MSEMLDHREEEILSPRETIEQRQNDVLDLFKEIGARNEQEPIIDQERWQTLLPEIKAGNIDQDPVTSAAKEKSGFPPHIDALVDGHGRVILGERFFNLNEKQQQHVLAHEASHRLTWLLARSAENPSSTESANNYAQIAELIKKIPTKEISSYTAYIEAQAEKDPALAEHLEEEKAADIFAQYITGKGKFGAMMKNKFLQFPDEKDRMESWKNSPEIAEAMGELDAFDDQMAPEEQQTFLADHPELADHFALYSQINSLLTNKEAMTVAFGENEEFDMETDFLEYDELANYIPEETPMFTRQPSAKQQIPNKPKPNLFNFLSVAAVG